MDFNVPIIQGNCLPSVVTSTLPVRKATSNNINDWTNATATGLDEVHVFKIQLCGPSASKVSGVETINEQIECLQPEDVVASITYATNGLANGGIILNITGNTNTMAFSWRNGSGTIISTQKDLPNRSPGLYCVTIKDLCCEVTGCYEVNNCGLQMTSSLVNPTVDEPNTGEIHVSPLNGLSPYSFKWSSGPTTSDIVGVTAGHYCVTISDSYQCTLSQCFDLIPCNIIPDANVILSPPSDCGTEDGGFKSLNLSATGGVYPYAYHYEDVNGNTLYSNGLGLYSDLASGTYCLIATDIQGCRGKDCFYLYAANEPILSSEILPACPNSAIGTIVLTAFPYNNETALYDITWSTGQEDLNTFYSTLNNLLPGQYCATITSNTNDCEVESCFNVPELIPSSSLTIESSSLTAPCPNAYIGTIQLTVSGGIAPYSYDWSDINGLTEPEDRTGLGQGNYSVKVTDYCGSLVTKTFELKYVTASLSTVPGCQGQGQATVSVTYGNPPYSYHWSNGAVVPTISNLNSGNYCVTITDAAGCQVSKCVDMQNKEFTVIPTTPCVGMSDGALTMHIFNPNGGAVTLKFSGNVVYQNPHAGVLFDQTISSLNGDATYNFELIIDGCTYNTSTHLENNEIQHVYDHFDEVCYYNDWCNGSIIP